MMVDHLSVNMRQKATCGRLGVIAGTHHSGAPPTEFGSRKLIKIWEQGSSDAPPLPSLIVNNGMYMHRTSKSSIDPSFIKYIKNRFRY